MPPSDKATRLKLLGIKVVIVLGCIPIGIDAWDRTTAGNHNPGSMIPNLLLTVITGGIPMVFFAAVAFLLLAFFLFKPGEREAYEARQRLKELRRQAGETLDPEQDSPARQPGGDKYAD